MALAKGTNSYATVDEAAAYFADRLDVAAWDDADATQRAKSLVSATSILEDQAWSGTAISTTQTLAFPRSLSYFEPRLGCNIALGSEVPERIIRATFELAYHLLNNDGLQDDAGAVTSLQISSINLSSISNPNLIPGTVKRLIKPLLQSGGQSNWWRAN